MITRTSIAPGPQGTLETLRIMAGLVRDSVTDPAMRHFGRHFRTAGHVDRIIRPSYRYVEEEVETLYTPEFNLGRYLSGQTIVGDCDDISMFYAAIFKSMGLSTRFVALRTRRNDPQYFHVVVEVYEDNRWKRFDPTVIPGLTQIDYGQMIEYV